MEAKISENLEKMLQTEKKYAKIFYEKIKFDDENHFLNKDLINFLINNENIINKIVLIIEDVFKISDRKSDFKYIILFDFLTIFFDHDVFYLESLIFKLERRVYFEKIKMRAKINTLFGINFGEYIITHQKLLIGLRIEGFLERLLYRNHDGEKWNTNCFYIFNANILKSENFSISLAETPFYFKNILGEHYLIQHFRNIHSVKRKKKEMREFQINLENVEKYGKIPFVLSKNLLKLNEDLLNENKEELLQRINCKNFKEYYSKFYEVLKNWKKNSWLVSKILSEESDEDTERLLGYIKSVRKKYDDVIEEYEKVVTHAILEKDIFDKRMFLPSFVDNRGRFYFSSFSSPTFCKIFRNLYEFAEKKSWKNLENSFFFNELLKYKELIKNYNLDNKNSYIALVLFIEIGKFFIKDKPNIVTTTEDMIRTGIEEYVNPKKTKLKLDEKMYIKKIVNELDKLMRQEDIDEGTVIYKDATASGLQNYGISLGYKYETLRFLNIHGEDWCDTYKYVIERYLETRDESFKKRKYWKSTIMTIPYNAKWFPSYRKFVNELTKDNLQSNFDDKKLQELHKNFYEKVKRDIKKDFYSKERGDEKEFIYDKWEIETEIENKVNYRGKRDKYVTTTYKLIMDEKATKNASEANNMHYLDAQLAHFLMKKFEIISIHDCFGIRLNELHLLMDEINEYYGKHVGFKTYSKHIIL